ncbi:trace amine-associated receptor 13c-like [Sphaeramia orbicularis]|uniref:trace amine-associated receptor 13c-like n=1 Tax=Sphaeramia orbicularis TaxID=375764 RepID=UPI00117DBE51|nr:trace amine-associated receptor 13c-like [Sphaeramia orbicularis]
MEVQDEPELCFPQLLNTSCRKPLTSATEIIVVHVLLAIISVLTVILNLLVIISICHFRQLHTPTNLILLFLAFCDFLVGLVLLPGLIVMLKGCWFYGDLMCAFINLLIFIITSSSVGNMVLISIDRYVAICDPLHYTNKITMRRATVCICLCWLLSVIYNGIILREALINPERTSSCVGECVINSDSFGGAVDVVVTFTLPIIIILVLYMRVFVVAVSQARAMRSHISAVRIQLAANVTCKKSELKAARTLGVVVLIFLVCFCPYYCVTISGDGSVNYVVQHQSSFFSNYVLYFNSCLNPVIYALFYPWFRKAVKLIVTLQILQANSSETNML